MLKVEILPLLLIMKTIEQQFASASSYIEAEKEEVVRQHIIKKMKLIESLEQQEEALRKRIRDETAELGEWRCNPTKLMKDLLVNLPRLKDDDLSD